MMHYLQDFHLHRSFYRQNKEEHVIKPQVRGTLLGKSVLKVGGVLIHISIKKMLMLMMTTASRRNQREKRSRGGRRKEFDVRDH